jgi:hypothetical protein
MEDDTRAEFGIFWAGVLLLLAVLFISAFLWPTAWDYSWAEDGNVMVRRNRFTNRIEAQRVDYTVMDEFDRGQWVQVHPLDDAPKK